MAEVPLYDAFSADYDRFVAWEGRLAYERPFLLKQLESVGAHRVLDAACGTGQHSIDLAEAGYAVVGADLSEGMIHVARRNAAGHQVDVEFLVAGFGQLASRVSGTFDAVLCLGNSLPHALSADALLATLSDFRAVLRPGGALILQNRNFDQVWRAGQRFMPLETRREGEREWLFLRFYDFGAELITFNVVTLRREGEQWTSQTDSTLLRPVFRDELEEALSQAGFGHIALYGSLTDEPFDLQRSGNLVAVARAV